MTTNSISSDEFNLFPQDSGKGARCRIGITTCNVIKYQFDSNLIRNLCELIQKKVNGVFWYKKPQVRSKNVVEPVHRANVDGMNTR